LQDGVGDLVSAGGVNVHVILTNEVLDSSLLDGDSSLQHARNVISQKVDEGEFDGGAVVDLIGLSDESVCNDIVLKMCGQLVDSSRSLA